MIVYKIFLKHGMSSNHSKISAKAITNAELIGAPTHGLARLKMYCDRINKKLKIVGNFIFQTGQPTNYPNSQYTYMNLNVPNYGKRNSQRLPNYHRMDVNLTLNPEKKNKKVESSWVFGIYNLYNRDNASSIIFRRNNETLKNEAVQISIFGIVPSVTYNFKF